jgi:hypothetical protein
LERSPKAGDSLAGIVKNGYGRSIGTPAANDSAPNNDNKHVTERRKKPLAERAPCRSLDKPSDEKHDGFLIFGRAFESGSRPEPVQQQRGLCEICSPSP